MQHPRVALSRSALNTERVARQGDKEERPLSRSTHATAFLQIVLVYFYCLLVHERYRGVTGSEVQTHICLRCGRSVRNGGHVQEEWFASCEHGFCFGPSGLIDESGCRRSVLFHC